MHAWDSSKQKLAQFVLSSSNACNEMQYDAKVGFKNEAEPVG